MRAGLLVAPISPNYSLSGDFTRLDHALALVQPALVFAQDSAPTARRSIATRTGIVTVDGKRGCRSAR
jgi:feruloyl-CoA synthase